MSIYRIISFILPVLILNPALVKAEQQLIYAARQNKTAAVAKLLDSGINPNEPGSRGRLPLIEAAGSCASDVVRLLIERGADINLKGPDMFSTPGSTALIQAVAFGCLPSVELLLKAGADANSLTSRPNTAFQEDGHSILGYAIGGPGYRSRPPRIDRLGIVKALIKAGADVNFRNAKGQTPLMLSVTCGKCMDAEVMPEIYQTLIDSGAKLREQGEAVVKAAVFSGNASLAQKVREDLEKQGFSDDLKSAALSSEEFEDLKQRLQESSLPLDAFKFALKNRDISQSQLDEFLRTAAIFDRVKLIPYLVERGADINAQDSGREYTALMYAVADREAKTLNVLLESGAKPDIAAQRGETALSIAVRKGSTAIVKELLNAGADTSIAVDFEGTPIVIARQKGHRKIENLLLAASSSSNSPVSADQIEAQIRALTSPKPKERRLALEFFLKNAEFSESAVPALITAASSEHPDSCSSWECMGNTSSFQDMAVAALGRIGPKASLAAPTLLEILSAESSSDYRKKKVISALKQIRPPAAVPALTEVLRTNSDSKVLSETIAALAAIGPRAESALPELKKQLNSDRQSLREQAVAAISAIGGSKSLSVNSLISIIEKGDSKAKIEAVKMLGEMGPKAKAGVKPILDEIFGWAGGDKRFIQAATLTLPKIDPSGRQTIPRVEKYRTDFAHSWKAEKILSGFGK